MKEALNQSSRCDGAQKMELQLQEDVGLRKGVAFLEIGDRKVHVYDSIVQWRQKNWRCRKSRSRSNAPEKVRGKGSSRRGAGAGAAGLCLE